MLKPTLLVAVFAGALACFAPTAAADVSWLQEGKTFFPKGSNDLSLIGGTSVPLFDADEYFYSAGVNYGRYLFDNFSIRPGLMFHYADTEFKDVVGGEFQILLRYNFVRVDQFSFFVDAGAGVSYFDHRLTQPTGTHFNFSLRSGLGMTYEVCENTHLVIGAQWQHFSNSGIQGPDRHPSADGAFFYGGLMWTF